MWQVLVLSRALEGLVCSKKGKRIQTVRAGDPFALCPDSQISIQPKACGFNSSSVLPCDGVQTDTQEHVFVTASHDWRRMLQVLKSVFGESLCCLMVCLQQLFVPPYWQQEMVWGSSALQRQGMTSPIKGRWCKNGLYSLNVGKVPSSHKSDKLGCCVQKGTTIEAKHWAVSKKSEMVGVSINIE